MTYHRVCNKSNTTAAQQRHEEQELKTLPEHLSSPSDFDGGMVISVNPFRKYHISLRVLRLLPPLKLVAMI
jgi:hypothetical protein